MLHKTKEASPGELDGVAFVDGVDSFTPEDIRTVTNNSHNAYFRQEIVESLLDLIDEIALEKAFLS